ncbi:putative glycoside hydrolase [Methanobrevibacter sp.]|uniref:putative glycoside hydrolase n=1 Tax=Methanobrevibacter sp. TaxID=66852 RepID=UPI00386E2F3C
MAAFLSLGAVFANDVNETVTTSNDDALMAIDAPDSQNDDALMAINDEVGQENGSEVLMTGSDDSTADKLAATGDSKLIKASFKVSSNQIYIKNSKVHIKLVDGNKNRIVNKTIHILFKEKTYNLTTNEFGKVYFKIKTTGNYRLTYSFNEPGYVPVTGYRDITIAKNNVTKLSGNSYYVAYEGVKNPYVVTLTVGGVPLPNQNVIFRINGTYYTKKTDSQGKITLNFNYPQGTYKIKYIFKSTTNAIFVKNYAKIKVKKGMPTEIVKLNSPVFKNNKLTTLKFKYLDVRGNPINKKTVVLKVDGVKYKQSTDKNGFVKFKIRLNTGTYAAKVYSYTTVYKQSGLKFYISVKSDKKYNNGFWLFGADMYGVDLKKMADNGINQIFLNFYAVKLHGRTAVQNFVADAKSVGISVHIWMQAFYNGGWILPVDDSGNFRYSLFNSIIAEAKDYASIKGVAGIHFDYLRFGGTAYKHANGVEAINYFTKQACEELHKQNPSLIVSAAVMPEPSGMIYYYGQDIPTISKYLDVIVPMIYKGNYAQGTSWIKSTTQKFIDMSNGAEIWTGLQSYYSDDDVSKLPASELKSDSKAGIDGGAKGIILFRFGLFNLFDFNTL